MDKSYDPKAVENRWYAAWEERGYFAPPGEGEPYTIMLPPPNVTGRLHMGHAFQDTIMDALIRYHRMRGRDALWQGGTDHAGIATQMVVERQLAAEGTSRHELGRESFLERVWAFKEQSGGHITGQLRRLGASIDWDHERFTMDEAYSEAVTEHFVRLYQEKDKDGKRLIYRGKRLVNWDPVLLTALSDLEVVNEEENGHLWHMRYPRTDGGGHVIVATTRPETMLGDTAVAVHPDDERYTDLVGKTVRLPLADRDIPVIADEYVDPEFGSGCVKITPAHDFNDYEVGKRHGQEPINILVPDATLNNNVPKAYRGLDRFEARKRVVADLEAQGLLEKTERHRLTVPRGDRSGAVLEPYLTDQWFVRAEPLAQRAIEAVRAGRIRLVPENWDKTYYEWLNNIQDWCISRQLWWGHRIPAWYDKHGRCYVARTPYEAYQKYLPSVSDKPESFIARLALDPSDDDQAIHQKLLRGGFPQIALAQDEDVFDTWFSSALWPFATLGWPESTERLARYYPTSVLVTGFDIIFFWVARMVMAGLHFMDEVPFREVYIHGLIRDAQGQKMSKSKGNVLDPIDLIDGIELEDLVAKRTEGLMQPQKRDAIERATRREFPDGIPAFGADALRFTFAALATTGRDIRLDLGRVEGYRNFCNKLWNAARFVLMNCEGHEAGAPRAEPNSAARWIRHRFNETVRATHERMAEYRLDLVAHGLYEFTWNEYCDWYVELAKHDLQAAQSDEERAAVRQTLLETLEGILRLLHPVMPFITEEIWQRVAHLAGIEGDTVMLRPQPEADGALDNEAAARELEWLQAVVSGVRQVRSEMNVPPGKALPLKLQGGGDNDRERAERFAPYIRGLARVDTIDWAASDEALDDCATSLAGKLKLAVPMAGLIDVDAEIARLEKEIGRRRKDLEQSETKLGKDSFVNNAPPEIVDKERTRAADHRAALEQLTEQLERIRAL